MPPTRFLLALLIGLAPAVGYAHAVGKDMATAATNFLASLSTAQKKQATYEFRDAERENWHFVPRARHGLPFKEMNPAQRDLALALLRTGLGKSGFARAEAVMSLELVLRELEAAAQPAKRDAAFARRDPGLYFVTVFGPPATDKTWGWRFEGHHLAFNFTVAGGSHIFFAPSFIGSNPAEVPHGPRKGERVLAEEEDLGHALVKSLDANQRAQAIFETTAPRDIITGNKTRVDPLAPAGIPAAQLSPDQRKQLLALVKLYVQRYRPELVDETWAKITAAGVEKISFGWAGAIERGHGSYYRIQGPAFLIEFDNTQGNANHIHSVYRDFKGDFGHDWLREHYAKEHR